MDVRLKAYWLLQELSVANNEDDTIEVAYSLIRNCVTKSEYDVLDEFLRIINVNKFPTSVLLSILTGTALSKVADRLQLRTAFFDRVKKCLIYREGPKNIQDLLFGLE